MNTKNTKSRSIQNTVTHAILSDWESVVTYQIILHPLNAHWNNMPLIINWWFLHKQLDRKRDGLSTKEFHSNGILQLILMVNGIEMILKPINIVQGECLGFDYTHFCDVLYFVGV